MALTLTICIGLRAQNEGEQTAPLHKKALLSVVEDAKSIVTDSHYTNGQSALQTAIGEAEGGLETLESAADIRAAVIALQTAIDEFVEANEYVNATELVANPSFDKDANNSKTVTGWTVTNFKQNRRGVNYVSTSSTTVANFVEQWVNATQLTGAGDINQTLTKLPAGHYRLKADVFAINQKTDELDDAVGIELYLNENVREIGLSGTLSAEQAVNYGLDVDVAEGETLTIGFRFADTNVNWLGWDNVTLYYIGSEDDYNAVVNAEKLQAAHEALAAAIQAARDALAREDAPFYRTELEDAIAQAVACQESTVLEEVEQAKEDLDQVRRSYENYNGYYTRLVEAIAKAEELLKNSGFTEGVAEYQARIDAAKADLQEAITTYLNSPVEAIVLLGDALETLTSAESLFRVYNASYANPANVFPDGGMASTQGWDILLEGSNPGLHINTSGTVENFSKPFMECWVASANAYGQENYARRTLTSLPDGSELPSGYYLLKAAALATRQGQPNVEVTGVKLQLGDQSVAVHTGDGVAKIFTVGYELTEKGGELPFGLYIDASTEANWIAWDEVEVQFVGPKDKFLEDYAAAVLGESLAELKSSIEEAKMLLNSVDPNGLELDALDITSAIEEAEYLMQNPMESTPEDIEVALKELLEAIESFYTSGVSPKDGNSFDFSRFLVNPNFDETAATGWEAVEGTLPDGTDNAYWWFGGSTGLNLVQEFQQTVSGMPAGNYLLDVNAAIRLDMVYEIAGYTEENKSKSLTSCVVYANGDSTEVHPFFYNNEALGVTMEQMMAMTNDWDYRHGNGTLISTLLKESGFYHSYVPFTLDEKGSITVGFRIELPTLKGQMPFIDYFSLKYYGNQTIDINALTGISVPENEGTNVMVSAAVFNLNGQMLRRGSLLEGLPKGIYVVQGRKVVVR